MTMNSFPSWWDSTITVYNKHTDKQTHVITWYRTVIPNCFWKYTGDKISIGKTMLETNNIICRIPIQENFKENYLWQTIPNDLKTNYFTLNSGDIIVRGEVTDEINEYKDGKRASDIIDRYKSMQGCMQVEEMAINIGGGRCNEHYYIKGV